MILSLGSVNILVWSIWNINERRPFTPKWYLPKPSKAFSEIVLTFKMRSCRAQRWRRRHVIFVDMKKNIGRRIWINYTKASGAYPGNQIWTVNSTILCFCIWESAAYSQFYKSDTSSKIWFGARKSMHWNCRFCYEFWFETSTKHLIETT